jgi:hypothetical protein
MASRAGSGSGGAFGTLEADEATLGALVERARLQR